MLLGLAEALASLAPGVPLLAFAPLLAKPGPKPKGPLDSPHRRRMLDIIRESPGITSGELGTRFTFNSGSLYHHLRILTDAGLVREETDGFDQRRTHLYVTARAKTPRDAARPLPSLSTEAREIALLVVMNPGLEFEELEDLAEVKGRALYHHVRRLTMMGLVSSSSPTRYRGLRAGPTLYKILDLPEPGRPRR